MPDTTTPASAAYVDALVAFARELRAAGVAVGSGDVLVYASAAAALDPADLVDLYWAGRTTLVTRRDQIPVYDEVFRRFFLGEASAVPEPLRGAMRSNAEGQSVLQVPATEPGSGEGEEQEARLGLMASDAEVLRHKSFASCTPDELAALRRIMVRIRLVPPRRRTRRTAPARAGRRPDVRRTMRETMRMHGHGAHDDMRYVPKQMLEEWAGRDPVEAYTARLRSDGVDVEAIERSVAEELERETEWALAQPMPDPATARDDVFADADPELGDGQAPWSRWRAA